MCVCETKEVRTFKCSFCVQLNGEPHWKRALATSTDIILKIPRLIKYLKVGYRKGRLNLHPGTFSQTEGEPITVQTCGVIECV